jgi:hypothetical protein
MMEELAIDSSEEFNPRERMEPIGASSALNNQLFSESSESGIFNETSRVHTLEQEQEQLTGSLMSLTTHFAQVQFRLKQVIAAPDEDKDRLLKELEEFAHRGCPDMSKNILSPAAQDQIIQEQRIKQRDLIEQLKNQLQDLEIYAYQVSKIILWLKFCLT